MFYYFVLFWHFYQDWTLVTLDLMFEFELDVQYILFVFFSEGQDSLAPFLYQFIIKSYIWFGSVEDSLILWWFREVCTRVGIILNFNLYFPAFINIWPIFLFGNNFNFLDSACFYVCAIQVDLFPFNWLHLVFYTLLSLFKQHLTGFGWLESLLDIHILLLYTSDINQSINPTILQLFNTQS